MLLIAKNGTFYPLRDEKVYKNGAWKTLKATDKFRYEGSWYFIGGLEIQGTPSVSDAVPANNGTTDTPEYWWDFPVESIKLPPANLTYSRTVGTVLERGIASNTIDAHAIISTTYVLPRVQNQLDTFLGYYKISGISVLLETIGLAEVAIVLDSSTKFNAKTRVLSDVLVGGESESFTLPSDGSDGLLWERVSYDGGDFSIHRQQIFGQLTSSSINITFASYSYGEEIDRAWAKLHSSRVGTITHSFHES